MAFCHYNCLIQQGPLLFLLHGQMIVWGGRAAAMPQMRSHVSQRRHGGVTTSVWCVVGNKKYTHNKNERDVQNLLAQLRGFFDGGGASFNEMIKGKSS
jgi:hypothetical protein